MKTILALLIVVSIGCGSYRSGQPAAASANKNDSFTPTSSSPASSAAELNSPSSEPVQEQAQKAGLWDPNDKLHVADRLLERVKQEGVVRISSVRASGERYVFVGEFKERWQFVPSQRPRPKTDLWVVNKNGAGLQRLTENRAVTGLTRLTDDRESSDPEWSPSGDRIAFVNSGSVCVLDIRSKGVEGIKNLFDAQKPSDDGGDAEYVEYAQPKWSANGKAVAALAKDGTTAWVRVATTEGRDICTLFRGFERYQWNSESELIVANGRFVFDWERMFSAKRACCRPRFKRSEYRTW